MNLAVTLLVAVAIASVIGTCLKQGQPYPNYVIKFGPFWFQVFRDLGLYDVYGSGWFLFIMTFLVASTSVCLFRNTPTMIKEMTRFRDHVTKVSLRALKNHREDALDKAPEEVEAAVTRTLRSHGYALRRKERTDGVVLSAMNGRINRMGYILSHLAIIVICVGGVINGNLPLKYELWTGQKKVATQDLAASQVPEQSRLPVSTSSFRGTVNIPEGSSANVVFLPIRDGYLMQQLPFTIKVNKFSIEHYPSGQPKSFDSKVTLYQPDGKKIEDAVIRVNHPLIYNGYSIFQSSFGDGGSHLVMKAWPLTAGGGKPFAVKGDVFSHLPLNVGGVHRRLELTNFQFFNVRPNNDPNSKHKFRNIGPSFTYKLRKASGEALEYKNYMYPIKMDGHWYYLSGVRSSPAQDFRYLHIPADSKGSPVRFMHFLDAMKNPALVRQAAKLAASESLGVVGIKEAVLTPRVAQTAEEMVGTLLKSGFRGVAQETRARMDDGNIPQDRRPALENFARLVLERTLAELYRHVLSEEGQPVTGSLTSSQQAFFADALTAISALPRYGAPVFLQLTSYKQVQSSGLQISRAPGKYIVYLGFGLLVGGVFLLFYVAHRRIWALVTRRDDGGTGLLLAGVNQRDPLGFSREFSRLAEEIGLRLRMKRSVD